MSDSQRGRIVGSWRGWVIERRDGGKETER